MSTIPGTNILIDGSLGYLLTSFQLLDYYANLLIVQYHDLPNANLMVQYFVNMIVEIMLARQVGDAFNLDIAIGAQLNMMGTYRGIQRNYPGIVIGRAFWTFGYYNEVQPFSHFGWFNYGDTTTWYWARFVDTIPTTSVLLDAEMKRFIQYKADLQSMVITEKTVDDLMFKYFGSNIYFVDNLNMTLTFHSILATPDSLYSIIKGTNTFPKPAGVSIVTVSP